MMTPEQKIKHLIMDRAYDMADQAAPVCVTAENIDDLYAAAVEVLEDYVQDARNEVREGSAETDVKCEWSRHYESKSVACKALDGSWVGWTYWYGGGKHGEPEAIDWMDSAYDLTCVEEEKLVVVRTFTRIGAAA